MPTLKQLIPDAEVIRTMHPADLGGFVLEVLFTFGKETTGIWHRGAFCSTAGGDYRDVSRPRVIDSMVEDCCAEAWSWLEANWLICRRPDVTNNDWYMATRRGKEIRDRAGVRALIESEQLPEHFIHARFVSDVRPLFLQGRYDLAVFEAFHRLEIDMRNAAGLGNEFIGTKLAANAFNPESGKLTDLKAEAGERQALMNLMCGALGSYKNPQSHRHVGLDATEAREMIVIASHLLKIVDSRSPA